MSGRRWRDELLAPTVFAAVVAVFSVAGPAGCGSTGGGTGGSPGAGRGGGTAGAGGGGASGSGVDAGGGRGGAAGTAGAGVAGGGVAGAAATGAGGGRGGAAGTGAGGRGGAAGTGAGGVGGAGGGAYRIAVGGQRACAVSAAGVVYCWGTNTNLLGLEILDNYSLDSAAPVDMTPFLGEHAVDSAVTDFDLCLLKDEGSVFCAGGDGSELVSGIGGPAVQICAGPIGYGFGFGCAVRSDGNVFCWDDNGSSVGVLDAGGPWQAVQATGVENAVAVACDAGTACAVQSDGTVWCWGGGWGTPVPSSQSAAEVPRLVSGFGTDAAALAGGEGGICAFSSTGVATCIGSVFGVTRSTPPPAPIAVPALNGARTLAIGDRQVCAVGTDGQLRCWGANDFGQLADGTFVAHAAPALAPSLAGDPSAIVQLAAGEGVTCASLADGSVRCVGSNDRGALGDGSALSVGAVPVSLAAGAHVAAYQAALDTTGFAVQSDGSVVAWGGLPSLLAPPGGPPLQSAAPAPVSAPPAEPAAVQASVTDASACVLAAGGGVSCLGTSAPASFSVVSGLASGVLDLDGNCGILAAGGVRCGIGSTGYSPSGTGSTGAVAALAFGFGGNCLLRPDGTVACWQASNSNSTALAPVQDLDGAATAIAVGDDGCAVRADGAVLCWEMGQLSAQYVQLPAAAVGVTAASGVVCRRFFNGGGFGCFADSFHGHDCAWTAAGDLYCWGDNTFGQLGDGTTTLRTGVVQATAAGGPVLSASAGNRQTCAVRAADGRLVCWGWNGAGELGTGTGALAPPPRSSRCRERGPPTRPSGVALRRAD